MITRKFRSLLTYCSLFLIIISIILSACFSPYTGDQGTITINLGGGNVRSTWGDIIDGKWKDLYHKITVIDSSRTQVLDNVKADSGTQTFQIVFGSITVIVEAFEQNSNDRPAGTDPVARSTETRTINSSGQTISLTMGCYHNWSPSWTETTLPTCISAGVESRSCLRACGVPDQTRLGSPIDIDAHNESTKMTNGLCARVGCTNRLLYTIGDIGPGGGIIFHVVPAGFTVQGWGVFGTDAGAFSTYTAHYLEAATSDIGPYSWASATSPANNILVGTSNNLGEGRRNTAKILATVSAGSGNPSIDAPAANACINYGTAPYNDWFLPSSDEFSIPAGLHNLVTILGFSDHAVLLSSVLSYWVSSETSATQVTRLIFTSAGSSTSLQSIGTNNKTTALWVRPIRAF